MKIGTVITLKGLSRHGKNRIHEKGAEWKVSDDSVEKVSFNTPAPGPFHASCFSVVQRCPLGEPSQRP